MFGIVVTSRKRRERNGRVAAPGYNGSQTRRNFAQKDELPKVSGVGGLDARGSLS